MKKDFQVKSLYSLESIIKGAFVKKVLGLPVAVAMKITPHMYAKLLMSENTQNLWINLMRAIKDGSVRGVVQYSEELQKELEKEV
jgi:hypothetical protein